MPSFLKKTAFVLSFLLFAMPAAFAEDIRQEVLLKSAVSWDGTPYPAWREGQPELTVVRFRFPANSRLPPHSHPMPNAAYVARGELTVVSEKTGESRTVRAGDVLPEMVDTVHYGRAGPEPVELIVFYAGTAGAPLSVRAE